MLLNGTYFCNLGGERCLISKKKNRRKNEEITIIRQGREKVLSDAHDEYKHMKATQE